MTRLAGALLLLLGPTLLVGAGPADAKPDRAHAIRIDQPGTLKRAGGYYLLTRDVTAKTHGFVIAGKDITLDLGGHTLTYGTGGLPAFGVASKFQYHQGTITVTNGRIVQGAGGAKGCHGVDFEGGHDIHLHQLEIEVHGPDACGIEIDGTPTGRVTIDHNTVRCGTTVVTNRHYPGVAAIRLEDVRSETEIAYNRITASPQWGIDVAGKGATTACRIHHNQVLGTRALVANGYMIGVHRRGVHVYANVLEGASRGIHVDGVDHDGHHALIEFNRIVAQDQANPEYPKHWCHGIKLENTTHTIVRHNFVRVIADATHGEARALDIDVESGGPVSVHANHIEGLSRVPDELGKAIVWAGLQRGDPTAISVTGNVFVATDIFVQRTWHSDRGVRFVSNSWLPDPVATKGRPLLFERWDNQDGKPSPDHGFVDPDARSGTGRSTEWANPGAYTSDRFRTLRFQVLEGGKPAKSARGRIWDRTGALVQDQSLAGGRHLDLEVRTARLSPGPARDDRGPFRIEITGGGKRRQFERVEIRGPRAYQVDLGGGPLKPDLTPPAAPTALVWATQVLPRKPGNPTGTPREAAFQVLRWQAPRDPSGIAFYELEVGGHLWVRTRSHTGTRLGGLAPGQTHSVRVRAVDAGGNRGPLSKPQTLHLPALQTGRSSRRTGGR